MRIDKGILYAATAYICWGIFPLYFKALHNVPAFEIVAHRVIWSFLFLILVVAARRELSALKLAVNRRTALIYLLSGSLLTINWATYVYGVNAGFVVETSLGYFITPLVNVLLGVIFLREKLRLSQWVPIAIASGGVAYLTFNYGSAPWIALILATSFGMYGLIKKIAPLGSLYGLSMETGAMLLPALGYLSFLQSSGNGAIGHVGGGTLVLLLLSGLVTALPLLLFASGARRVPLTVIGLLQYISPTLQFLLGVFLFGETFTQARLIGFSIIWLALILFSAESYLHWRKAYSPAAKLASEAGSPPS